MHAYIRVDWPFDRDGSQMWAAFFCLQVPGGVAGRRPFCFDLPCSAGRERSPRLSTKLRVAGVPSYPSPPLTVHPRIRYVLFACLCCETPSSSPGRTTIFKRLKAATTVIWYYTLLLAASSRHTRVGCNSVLRSVQSNVPLADLI